MPTDPQQPAGAREPDATLDEVLASPPASAGDGTLPGLTAAPDELATVGSLPPVPPPKSATIASATDSKPPASGNAGSNLAPTEMMDATGVFTPPAEEPARPDATEIYVPGQTNPPGRRPLSDTLGYAATEAMDATAALAPTVPATCDGAPPAAGRERRAPEELRCGRYLLKHFHARGGMGEVWMAEDPEIGRPVALKRMLGRRPDQIHRFRVEAQVTGQLEHPGIVPVHELGLTEQGDPFYAMKFVQGRTLKKVVEEFHAQQLTGGARDVEQLRLLQMFLSLCQTVAYAHSRGVLHRDLKPENVMLGPYGETVLLDWGIAKIKGQPEGAEASSPYVRPRDAAPDTETQAGAIMGTPAYMAPEVAAGLTEEVDERSDLYLLGATLYEMLTGRQPRSAKTAFEMVKKAKEEPPRPARSVNPLVPRALDAICRKAMAYRKEDRYPTALALADDIQRFIAGEPVSAYLEPWPMRAWRWAKRHRVALSRSAAAVLVIGFSLFATMKIRQAELRRLEAVRVAEALKTQEQARLDVQDFRRLADEASYYIATNDPLSPHAPYYDPRRGEAIASQALAVASKWGPQLNGLAVPSERAPLKSELAELLLLTAHSKSRLGTGPDAAKEVLALVDRASHLQVESISASGLRSRAQAILGASANATGPIAQPNRRSGLVTAFDHFLQGETLRRQSGNPFGEGASERKVWEPDRSALEKAIAEYRQALGLDPDHYWSWFQLGRCSLSLGRLTEAVDALGTCVALRPQSPWGYSARGLALQEQGNYSEAESDLNRALQLAPETRQPRLNRGLVYWRQKKHELALADFDGVLQGPREAQLLEALYYRGRLHMERNEQKQALDDLNRVVAASPGYLPVYLDRPLIFLAQNQAGPALDDLDTYVRGFRRLDPGGWEIHALRGRLLRRLYSDLPLDRRSGATGKTMLSVALTELIKAVKTGGNASGLFDDVGAMLEHAGQVREAIVAYGKGLESEPSDLKLRIKRGWAWEQIGQHEKAFDDFEAAAKVQPENAEAHTGMGYVRALLKRPTEAQREADLALLHGGDRYLILHNVACIYSTLSAGSDRQDGAHQDVAMALLRRAVTLWKQAGSGPSEVELMKAEPAFQPLRGRDDFRDLIRNGGPAATVTVR